MGGLPGGAGGTPAFRRGPRNGAGAPASLRVIRIGNRYVARHFPGALAPCRHFVLPAGAGPSPGLYFGGVSPPLPISYSRGPCVRPRRSLPPPVYFEFPLEAGLVPARVFAY